MYFSTVTNFVTNQVYRVLAECKGSMVHTAMVAATNSTGLTVLALAYALKKNRKLGAIGVLLVLSSGERHTRIAGTIFSIFWTAIFIILGLDVSATAVQKCLIRDLRPNDYQVQKRLAIAHAAAQFLCTRFAPLIASITPASTILALSTRACILRLCRT